MQVYLEILEEKETNPKQTKIKVTDKQEALDKATEEEIAFSGLTYIKRVHYCRHDEGQPCTVENI